jgi:hypothetical protein
MKAKLLFTALALPVAFAACTSDEMETLGNTDLGNRIQLQNVNITLGNAATRMVQGDGNKDGAISFNELLFEANDGMGACLIDEVATDLSQKDPVERYNLLTDKVNSNYRYSYNGSAWSTQAKLVEGNYMFYLPYSEEAGRGAIVAKLPAVQKLAKDANGELSTFNDVLAKSKEAGTPLYVGYKFLSADKQDLNIAVDVLPLYAQPLITLRNLADKKITVKSVTLKKGSGVTFELEKPFKYAHSATTAYTESAGDNKSFVQSMFNAVNGESGKEGRWISNKNTEPIKTADVLGESVDESESVISIEMPEGGIELADGASFSFYAMIPADDYTSSANALTAEINTTDGESCEVVFNDMNINPGKRYPVEEYDAETNQPASTAGTALGSIIIGLQAQTGVAVSSTADLIDAIRTFTPKDGANELEIRVVDQKNTEINSTVATLLKNKSTSVSSSKITFSTPVVINNAGTLAVGNNYTLTFSKMVTLKGTNNIAASSVIVFREGITVAEGASAALAGTITGGVKNEGTLVLSNVTTTSITNKGTFTLDEVLTGTVTNLGTMSIKGVSASITSTLTNGDDKKTAAILNVEKGASITLAGAWTNNEGATINNLGTITDAVAAALTNNGTIVNGASNNADATITGSTGSLNAGIVTNYGVVNFNKNEGDIKMMSFLAEATVGTSSEKWGNIYNDADAKVTDSGDAQYIWKTVTGDNAEWKVVNGKYNSVIYKDAKITVAAVAVLNAVKMKAVVFENTDIAVTGAGSGAVWQLPVSIVVNGNVNIAANADAGGNNAAITIENKSAGSSLTISENAELKIINQSGTTTFTAGDDGVEIVNKGKVQTNVTITKVLDSSTGVWSEGTEGKAKNWIGVKADAKS